MEDLAWIEREEGNTIWPIHAWIKVNGWSNK